MFVKIRGGKIILCAFPKLPLLKLSIFITRWFKQIYIEREFKNMLRGIY